MRSKKEVCSVCKRDFVSVVEMNMCQECWNRSNDKKDVKKSKYANELNIVTKLWDYSVLTVWFGVILAIWFPNVDNIIKAIQTGLWVFGTSFVYGLILTYTINEEKKKVV